MNEAKLNEIFSDKAYVESITQMSAEDAAKSLREKGVDVTADDLMKVRDFAVAHKEQLQNGELDENALAGVAGGMTQDEAGLATILIGIGGTFLCVAALAFAW